jgi:hypothetical protein
VARAFCPPPFSARKASPRSTVVVVEIDKSDKDLDKLPSVVVGGGQLPRIPGSRSLR